MQILLINSEYPPIGGGAGNASAHLARSLVASGHKVTVLTVRFGDLPGSEAQNNLRIVRVKALRARKDRSNPFEQFSFVFSGLFGGFREIRKCRPDIIICFFGVPSGVIGLLLNYVLKIPYVVSLRGGDVPGFRPYDFAVYHKLISPLIRTVWKQASAVVANSIGLKELASNFDNNRSIEIIANGIDRENFKPYSRQWEPARILFTGRLVYQKGLDILLDALASIKSNNWQLKIVGDGPELDNLIKHAEKLNISGQIVFSGWKYDRDLIDCYQQANIFVYPSRHEGMPNAILEAMSMGLPVVATNISGSEELVVDGLSGCLIQPEHRGELKSVLIDLIGDPQKLQRMGAASRDRIEKYYSWEKCSNQYLKLVERILKNDHAA